MSMGTIIYYLLWPLIWFYSPLTTRVRVLIVHNGECLQVINWFGSGTWSLPGGGIKFGEKPLQTGLREVHEELNVSLDKRDAQLLTEEALVHYQNGLLKRNHYVLAHVSKKPTITLSKEITKTRWVKLADVTLPEQIRQTILTL